MADPITPSMPRNQSGEVPHWFMIAGGIVAVVALFVFMKNKQSATGGSTVAASTSINAALGSIQEEVLQQTGALSVQAAKNQDATMASLNDIGSGVGRIQTNQNNMGLVDSSEFRQIMYEVQPNEWNASFLQAPDANNKYPGNSIAPQWNATFGPHTVATDPTATATTDHATVATTGTF